MDLGDVVIVGASLAGVRAGEALRRHGYAGRLRLVGAERHFPPYDRPPMSKELLLGTWQDTAAALPVDDLGAELLLGRRAVGLDLAGRTVSLADGERLSWDGLVVATGAAPHPMAGLRRGLAGVHTLRTIDDCRALRAELAATHSVVVVGAGFIGSEVAASCRALGCAVTLVDVVDFPMGRVLTDTPDAALSTYLTGLHAGNGTTLRLGTAVTRLLGTDRVCGVALADGTTVEAGVVVLATGVAPGTGWLAGSGLAVADGLLLDEYCRAGTDVPVVGAGDVACWFNPLFGRRMRVEHWTNAGQQAEVASRTLLAFDTPPAAYDAVPYFWTHLYGQHLQFVGVTTDTARLVAGDRARFVVEYVSGDRVLGALCVNFAGRVPRYRRAIRSGLAMPAR